MEFHHRKYLVLCAAAFSIALVFSANAVGQSTRRVHFERGTHSATETGRLRGFAYQDFVLGAKAGQLMTVKLHSNNDYTNFVIFTINGHATNMVETQDWSDRLNESGDVVVRVAMMRAGARKRGAVADFSLFIEIK